MGLPDYKGYKELLVTLENGVLTVLINRAKQRNTFNGPTFLELVNVFELADLDDRVKAVILTAEHTAAAYCSGADIAGGWDLLFTPEEEKEGEHAHRDSGGVLALTIYRCRKLTIAAVNGHAAGVGMTALQLPFDVRFAWSGAKLTFPFVRRGIVPEATSSYLLPRLLGQSRAMSLLLTGETITPDHPHISALYHQILPTREAVYPTAKAFAEELAANTSQVSIALAKGLVQHPGDSAEENHLNDSRSMRITGKSVDAAEGVKSFFERRPPRFAGKLSTDLPSWHPWWRPLDVKHRKTKL
ncbi:hypothetical protein CVT24_008620 [Panaeolus cyanescens]|uniref:Enoyl-CoA hydratase n=1 Tax=Panaeolus cyanescens TaxID=181874 RepID=A0A409VB85_9AGAR|nr:hypothetical protein CVT24_008620 [Panaeolus cyanescens]